MSRRENLPNVDIGDLVLIIYDCWLHHFGGSEFVRRGEFGIVIERRNKLLYKPVRIRTTEGKEGWIYSSNIKVFDK